MTFLEKVDKQHKAYKIEQKDGKYTLRVASYMMLSANFKGYYVETQTNIGAAYTQRQDMVRMYHYIVCVVLLCCVIVSLILSYFLTYRIRGLSVSPAAAQTDPAVYKKGIPVFFPENRCNLPLSSPLPWTMP